MASQTHCDFDGGPVTASSSAAAPDELLENCVSSKSDSALGSELVDEDFSDPLSVLSAASLSDDEENDEENDDDVDEEIPRNSEEVETSAKKSPLKKIANSSPLKCVTSSSFKTNGDVSVTSSGHKSVTSTGDISILSSGHVSVTLTRDKSVTSTTSTSSSDANDNVLASIPKNDESTFPASSSCSTCVSCSDSYSEFASEFASDSVSNTVSDSRDGDNHISTLDSLSADSLRFRRNSSQSSSRTLQQRQQQQQQQQHHTLQGHILQSQSSQQPWTHLELVSQSSSLTPTSGVEDVETFAQSTLPNDLHRLTGCLALSTDHLADSCDEDDAAAAAAIAGVETSSSGGCAAVASEKKHSNSGESAAADESGRNSSFSKWDPTSWPSWFERLFTNNGASPESSFDDDVVVDQNGSCLKDEDQTSTLTRSPSLSKSEFTCSCCFELMVEPTTIQCGHSFCRCCLANWYFGSNSKRTCPQCRQSWNGNPQTNVILRTAIRTLFPSELSAREAETRDDVDAAKKLKQFDAAVSGAHSYGMLGALARRLFWPRTGNGFVNGVVFGFSVFFVIYLAFSWGEAEAEDMTTVIKPIVDWRVKDVAAWLDSLGPWTRGYRESFVDNAIDGQLVLALTDRDLQEHPFEMKAAYHRRAFLTALTATRNHGSKPPTNLWEYKAAKPGTALLLLWGLKSLPRHTILVYMLIFDYESILLPFVHITCPLVANRDENILGDGARRLDPAFWELQPFRRKALFFQSLVSSKTEEDENRSLALQNPSLAQWVEFVAKALVLPHFLVAEVAWDWLNVHYWTVRFILMDCLFLSAVEVFRLRLLCQRDFAQFFTPYSAVIQEICLIAVVGLVWRFLPSLLCDVVFYSLLYVFPFLRMLNFVFRTASFLVNS